MTREIIPAWGFCCICSVPCTMSLFFFLCVGLNNTAQEVECSQGVDVLSGWPFKKCSNNLSVQIAFRFDKDVAECGKAGAFSWETCWCFSSLVLLWCSFSVGFHLGALEWGAFIYPRAQSGMLLLLSKDSGVLVLRDLDLTAWVKFTIMMSHMVFIREVPRVRLHWHLSSFFICHVQIIKIIGL